MQKLVCSVLAVAIAFAANVAFARDQIRIVGSSTVYPFITAAAEEFGNNTGYKTPIVESTGTGGGFKLFCSGAGEDTPDFSNASRAIKQGERDLCTKNGIKDITEVKVGYDGIVIANSNESRRYTLTKKQIFLALGKKVPSEGGLKDNFYTKWNEIDPSLPAVEISVYGPPPTSGTRDAFVELVMEEACHDLPEFKAAYPEKDERKKTCHLMREDGKYIEAGENDNLIVQKLKSNPDSLGIFGFSFLEENLATVQGSLVDGVEPDFDNIIDGSYSISRPLFIYAKNAHISKIAGMKEFLDELTSTNAMGPEGYLTERGLVPLNASELEKIQKEVGAL